MQFKCAPCLFITALVLQMLGLQKGSLQSFVLENDPVPRALLSVDPTFTAFKQSRLGSALLKLRHSFLGPGVPLTPERFLADNVGQVNLIRWTPETGHKVPPYASYRNPGGRPPPPGGGGPNFRSQAAGR